MTANTQSEIRLMEKTCQLAARTLEYVGKQVRSGIKTVELDQIAHDYILSHGATPSPLNYHGFPKSICTSVNEVICHGVPDETILKEGDALNIDVTTYLNGFHGDTSATFFVGEPTAEQKALVDCAEQAMYKGIEAVRPNGTTGDIGFAINKFVTKKGYYPVYEIGGHGIGKIFHEDPFVPSFGKKGRGDRLIKFGCITVEPMVNQTEAPIKEFAIPGSTVKYYKTGDGTPSAQFEHTILVTDESYEILTML